MRLELLFWAAAALLVFAGKSPAARATGRQSLRFVLVP